MSIYFVDFPPLFISYKCQDVDIGLKAAFSVAMALVQTFHLQCSIEVSEAKELITIFGEFRNYCNKSTDF